MKVLLTGGSGQVGTEVRRRAGSAIQLWAPTRQELKLDDRHAVESAVRSFAPDVVVNAAAYTAVDRAEDDAEVASAINRDAVLHLGAACTKVGALIIHLSTDYVFDGRKVDAYREEDATGPIGVYGATKLAGEAALREVAERYFILRVSWVFAGHGSNFVKTMLRLGAEREQLRVVADQRGGPTYAGHIADAILALAPRTRSEQGGTYHYAGAPATTWFEFADAIFDAGLRHGLLTRKPQLTPISTSEYPTRAARPANSVMDCTKIREHFGINQPDWLEGLEQAVAELARERSEFRKS